MRDNAAPVKLSDGWSGLVFDSHHAVRTWREFLEELVHGPGKLPGYALLKHSRDRQVIRTEMPAVDGRCVVGRYVRAAGLQAWVDRIRGSAARRDARRLRALAKDGIETSNPLAFVERRASVAESWLVTSFLSDAADLDRVALTLLPQLPPTRSHRLRAALATAVATLVSSLERAGWRHRDLKASNVLICDWAGDCGPSQAAVVDLEGLRRRRPWSFGSRTQPLIRLAASLLDYSTVTPTDYVRFLRAYLPAVGRQEDEWRILFRHLSPKALRYAREAKRRKAHKLDGYSGA
jgi:hypothetical protein